MTAWFEDRSIAERVNAWTTLHPWWTAMICGALAGVCCWVAL